jgi:hypothetical protein
MNSHDELSDHPTPLPRLVRPRHGEGVEAYVRRLADSNHLKPSYLRKYLSAPPDYIGSVRARRLAAVTGRTVDALTRALPDLKPTARLRAVTGVREREHQARLELFEAIRREAAHNYEIRDLARMFNVKNRTIIQALVGRTPRRRAETFSNPRLEPLQEHIDLMIAADPKIKIMKVWQVLVDDHGAAVSYSTVRDYVTRRRRGTWPNRSGAAP